MIRLIRLSMASAMTNRTRRSHAQWQRLIEQQTHSGLNAATFKPLG